MHLKPADREHGRRNACHTSTTMQNDLLTLLLVSLILLTSTSCAMLKGREPEAEPAPTIPLPEVKRITFTGNTQFSSRTLLGQMATQPRPFLQFWKKGEPYNPPTLQEDLLRIRKYYFDRGFLETTARVERVEEDPEENTVSIAIAIEEGPPTRVEEVRLAGTIPPELLPTQEVIAALPLRAGERLNKAEFDQSVERLLTRLRNATYARAQVVPNTTVDTETHTAVVTFELRPGSPTTFGQITIEGEEQVKERAIRRQMSIQPGDPYNAEALQESVDAIYGLRMFQAVTPRVLNPDEQGAPMDVEIDVRERKPRSVELGFGFSTVEQFRAEARWTHRNIWAEANQLSLSAKGSSIQQAAEASFLMPYFLARRTSLSQTVYARNEPRLDDDVLGLGDTFFGIQDTTPGYGLFSIGAETRVRHQFTKIWSGAAGIEISRNQFSDVDPELIGTGVADDNTLFIQFAEVQRDTSDSLLNPTRGSVLRGELDHSNSAIISDASFFKLLLDARYYYPLHERLILATRFSIGNIEPYAGSDTVPGNVRFLAGGPGSVRGYAPRRVGPLDSKGRPLGGNSLLVGSVELRFPIAGDLGGVVFVDAGNVYSDSFGYDLGDLRYGAGPGIRYNTPVGPFRLDFGIALNPRTGDSFGRLDFSIGQAF
ncbi:MAG TPA: outer membrane protein assembly factor BamA [Candidatus Tectomicrobia bacterium]|nr:outer membrane protein assembly factor BamA [Candidatus Tectomicrobia bacterium]